MATPTPMEIPEVPANLTALPSPSACASVSAFVESVKRPPATTVRPVATVARELDFARLMPTAAATDTPPDDVRADGVGSDPPVPVPPFDVDVVLAKPRCDAT